MAINATIQVRRGLLKDFDPTKMLPGEWAVSVDTSTSNQIVWMCFAPGVCKRMGTYEDFQNMIYNATGEIIERYEDAFGDILEEVKTNAEAVSANTDIVLVAKSDIINTYLPQIKSYVSNASASASEAKTYSENAKASASEADKSAEDAKKYSQNAFSTTPEGYEALVGDVDVLKNSIIQTTDRTLYGSKEGGIKLIGIGGASEQGENPSPDNPQEIESVGDSGSLGIKASNEDGTISKSITIPLNEPLRSNKDKTVRDLVAVQDGVWGVLRWIYKKVLDSTAVAQGFTNIGTVNRVFFTIGSATVGTSTTTDFMTTSFQKVADYTLDEEHCYLSNGDLFVFINADKLSSQDASGVSNWLTDNNVECNFVRATPIFEPFTDQTPFYGLESFDTVTYISTDSEVEPSIELKFAKTEGDAVTLLNYNQTNLNRIAIAELTSAVLALNQE